MSALEFSRNFLAAFFIFVGLFYTVRLVWKRRTGAPRVSHGAPGSLHWYISLTFRLFRGVILLAMVARAVWPAIDPYFVPFRALMTAPVVLAGNALLLGCFAYVVYVHKWMGRGWRSGVHEKAPAELFTTGPFGRTRNPMFLGIQGAQLGFFLSFPSVFTLVCLIVGVTALHLQVRLEEAHLRHAFGRRYDDYRRRVPRWLPGTQAREGRPARAEGD